MNLILKIDTLLFIIIIIFTVYNLFFTLASLLKRKRRKGDHVRTQSFAVVFAAYKEDRVIIESVENFLKQDYPQDKYQVVVVSDHMEEETNRVLAQLPITLLFRTFRKA